MHTYITNIRAHLMLVVPALLYIQGSYPGVAMAHVGKHIAINKFFTNSLTFYYYPFNHINMFHYISLLIPCTSNLFVTLDLLASTTIAVLTKTILSN